MTKNEPKFNFSAAIFDMDGTIINNNQFHVDAFVLFGKLRNLEISETYFYQKIIGRTNLQIMSELFSGISEIEADLLGEEKESIYRNVYDSNIKEVEGLTAFLTQLQHQKIKLAIGTNGPSSNINWVLEKLKLQDFFNIRVNTEMNLPGKPNPAIFLKAAELLNTKPENCLVFEDSNTGIKAAKAAGMKVAAILTTHKKEELLPCDYYFNSFSEIDISKF